jgi:hypothetical protein
MEADSPTRRRSFTNPKGSERRAPLDHAMFLIKSTASAMLGLICIGLIMEAVAYIEMKRGQATLR